MRLFLLSSFRSSFLFMLKMVSIICCCWLAIVTRPLANSSGKKVGRRVEDASAGVFRREMWNICAGGYVKLVGEKVVEAVEAVDGFVAKLALRFGDERVMRRSAGRGLELRVSRIRHSLANLRLAGPAMT